MDHHKKLGWLEFGRGVAALIVVLSHSALVGAPRNDFVVQSGVVAVAFFFCLSGFIIWLVHADQIGQLDAAGFFVWRRLVRIFPTYWLVLSVYIALHYASKAPPDIRFGWLIHEFLLLPGGDPFLEVAWTLRHELLFYGLFLLLILNSRLGLAVFATWFLSIIFCWILAGPTYWISDISRPPLQTLFSPINLCFFPGMALAWLMKRRNITPLIAPPKLSLLLGKISYPLYLSHLVVYFVIGGILARMGITLAWPPYLILVVVACIFVAWAISHFFEAKLLWRIQGLVSSPKRSQRVDVI